jgi:hypothetical protein
VVYTRLVKKPRQSARAHPEKREAGNSRGPERSHLKDDFLAAFKSSGTILASTTRLSISREVVYGWLRDDADFAQKFADAQEDVTEMCETAAMARGVNGVESYVISGGKPVVNPAHACVLSKTNSVCRDHWLKTREYSDHMLGKLLEARRPEKYARKTGVEVKVDVKVYAEVMSDILGIIRRNMPDACPHCKTLLGVTPKIADEMEKLSKNFEVRNAAS